MTSIPTVPLLEGAAFTIPGMPEGAVEGDTFSQLLGQFAGAPGPGPDVFAALPRSAGAEAEVLPIAALIAAVRSLAVPKQNSSEAAEDPDKIASPPDESPDQPAATAASAIPPSAPQPIPLLSAATATPVVAQPAGPAPAPVGASATPLAPVEIAAAAPAKDIEVSVQPPAEPASQPQPSRATPVDRIVAAAMPEGEERKGEAILLPAAARTHAALPSGSAAAPIFIDSFTTAPASAEVPITPEQAIEQTVTQQLDLAHESEWLDRLATDIARTAGKEGSLRFRLHPESLGGLHVEMTQGAAGASIRLTADTEAARAIIADAQPRLLAEARAQGVRIAETHVDLGGTGSGHLASDEQRGRRGAPEEFLRTSGADGGEKAATDRPNLSASERYA